MITYYWICFILSVVLTIVYVWTWRENANVYNTCMFILIPIVNLGFLWLATSETLEGAFRANAITYLGACFWPPFATFSILVLCNIKPPKKIVVPSYILAIVLYTFVLLSDRDGLFYSNLAIAKAGEATILTMEYGIMHAVVDYVVGFYALAGIAVLVYCIVKGRRASITSMYLLLGVELFSVVAFLFQKQIFHDLKPAAVYTFSELVFLIVSIRSYHYYVNEAIMNSIVQDGALGYVSFDTQKRLLTANPVAEKWFPELKTVRTDRTIRDREGIKGPLQDWFLRIDSGEKMILDNMETEDRIISVNMLPYKMSPSRTGYRIIMRDGTDHQRLMTVLARQRLEAEKERRRVSETFERYLDPAVARAILRDGADYVSRGRERELAVLFADIRGFTTISEGRSPSDVFVILNRCLDTLAACIMQNRGTIDKFVGDCLMAFWNAPGDEPDAAYLAAKAAVDMNTALRGLNRELNEIYGLELSIGTGINFGAAIVGNAGSKMRSDYTAIGDTVNVAERLESIAKPGEILITRRIADQIDGRADFETAGEVKLKGKEKPIEVIRLISVGGRS